MQRLGTQKKREVYFESIAVPYWRDIYASPGTEAEVYRERHAAALRWIERLPYAPGSRALEIGCGAGFLSVAMARRGYHVDAVDASQPMVDVARRTAASSGLESQVHVGVDDACALTFGDASFDLVVAIAVLPWLRNAEPAIQEMARVLKPGGHVVLTADNWARLYAFLDPRYNPALAPLRRVLTAGLVRLGLRRVSPIPSPTFHHRRFIDETLALAGLAKVRSRTIGFGPFTVLGHRFIPESLGIRLHYGLQRLADAGVPGLRSTGGHYLVLARKS